jgi:hypothetical protein
MLSDAQNSRTIGGRPRRRGGMGGVVLVRMLVGDAVIILEAGSRKKMEREGRMGWTGGYRAD